jgi:cobaltochelatase CobS
MAKGLSDTEIANRCLNFLKTRDYTVTKTKRIVDHINEPFSPPNLIEHQVIRGVLNRLYQKGVISRNGNGSFVWKILVDSWDQTFPFKMQPGAPIITPKPKASHTHYTPSPPPPSSYTPPSYYTSPPNDTVTLKIEEITKLLTSVGELEEKVKTLESEVAKVKSKPLDQSYVKVLEVKRYDAKPIKLKDKILPKTFQRVFDLCRCRRNVLLIGPAGSGKTYLAKLVSDALGLKFASLSCTAGVSETHLLGRSVPDLTHGKNRFQSTPFLDVYENGGTQLLDEFDAADSNFALCINTGIANGYLNIPNRPDDPVAKRHEDFVCVATANTFGRGATRLYAGRGQLDEATLDRFRIGIVEVYYDPAIEAALCPDIGGEEGRSYYLGHAADDEDKTAHKVASLGYNLRDTCLYIRDKINASSLRRIMSTRFMEDAYIMVKRGGWSVETCLESFFAGWTAEERAKVSA